MQPRLDLVGWARWGWRQLTSMRTALILLLLLALAAVPGSLVPQRSSDPNGVIAFQRDNPDTFRVLDALGLFSTFSSPWFSAVYILLFVSLVGCVIPRAKHHWDALRARPPKTPARLERLAGFTATAAEVGSEEAISSARDILRRLGYRVERYAGDGWDSISAERGYLRETGNLVFHSALIGVLLSVGVGGGFGYTGQRVIVEDTAFTNSLAGYDSFSPGRFFTDSALQPFSLRLTDFEPEYQFDVAKASWSPIDFTATIETREAGGDWTAQQLKVNHPLEVGGTEIYLLGNGFAPIFTIRTPEGEVVQADATPFLPQDGNLTSLGVVKVPDGLADQVGIIAFLYPDPMELDTGAMTSFSPYPEDPLATLTVYRGDLGLDEGAPVNAYNLTTDDLELLAGRTGPQPALELHVGDTVDLPKGLGTIEFTGWKRFVSLDIHHDPTQGWVLGSVVLVVLGLLVSLFVPRRRAWIKWTPDRIEYAGLARGEDPTLEAAVRDLAGRHAAALGLPPRIDP